MMENPGSPTGIMKGPKEISDDRGIPPELVKGNFEYQSIDYESTHHDNDVGSDGSLNIKIGEKESKAVNRVMLCLVAFMLILTAAVSTAVYELTRGREIEYFEREFVVHANEVISAVSAATERSFHAIESFSKQITIHAIDKGQNWPEVVLTDFQSRAQVTMNLAEVVSLFFLPIVTNETRRGWEAFSAANQGWLEQSLAMQQVENDAFNEEQQNIQELEKFYGIEDDLTIRPEIFELEFSSFPRENGPGPYTPLWQFAPALPISKLINFNTLSLSPAEDDIISVIKTGKPIVSQIVDVSDGSRADDLADSLWRESMKLFLEHKEVLHEQHQIQVDVAQVQHDYSGGPMSAIYAPITNDFGRKSGIAGILASYVYWQTFLENILQDDVKGLIVVLGNNCGNEFSYKLDGGKVTYVGEGVKIQEKYAEVVVSSEYGDMFLQDVNSTRKQCFVKISVYPTQETEDLYTTNAPSTYTWVFVCTFLIVSLIFVWYQCAVEKRLKVVMDTAIRSTAVVQSLFPANVRERLFEDPNRLTMEEKQSPLKGPKFMRRRTNESGYSDDNDDEAEKVGADGEGKKTEVATSEAIFGSKPIADHFPSTTIMFADMVGFTAWSSVHEPTQVFTLLETVFHNFDMVAKRLRVFKVETVGDCYVAVCGLPHPREDHAVVMARFALRCRNIMRELTYSLETYLGPDTAELQLRIGLHSGPVTAGVLRGIKGRFQLFGDTMNTASRMESTGCGGKIHMSRFVVDHLIKHGKASWVIPREEKVVAKGKGELQTYWLQDRAGSTGSSSTGSGSNPDRALDDSVEIIVSTTRGPRKVSTKTMRLVRWNVDVLSRLIKQILARRQVIAYNNGERIDYTKNGKNAVRRGSLGQAYYPEMHTSPGKTVLDEVIDVIGLPAFDANHFKRKVDPEAIHLPDEAVKQLTEYVTSIACMYRTNPFHNFEHASHVTLSVTKLLSRIVNPAEFATTGSADHEIAQNLHEFTFGITSDPLTQFACVFSALIHDMDHPGVANATLVKEQRPVAVKYKNKSVAEQNSVDMAWEELMHPKYLELRKCIYADDDELKRFRQLVVNIVLATDILDRDLGLLRKARWDKAFNIEENLKSNSTPLVNMNRKATIVIEHLIQASDVAHTMQHWHVYRKWTERLFHEVYGAYLDGHIPEDPSTHWYDGEIAFYDYYIVPLARKLETCGVFGVSCDEYLNYALHNRREWEDRGEGIVKEFLSKYAPKDEETKEEAMKKIAAK